MHDKEGETSYQMKNMKLEIENEVRKMKRLSFECLGEGEILFYRERSGRNGIEIAWILFIGNLSFLMDREVSRIKNACFICRRVIQNLSKGVHS